MRLRDHLLNMGTSEALDLIEKMGISREDRVVNATITLSGLDMISFEVTRKVGGYGIPIEFEVVQWVSHSAEFQKSLIRSLGIAEGERVVSIVISLPAGDVPTIVTTKHADDRLLDLDWSLVAKGAK